MNAKPRPVPEKIPIVDEALKLDTTHFLTDAQFQYEIEKCENCEEKPCKDACPSGISPMDFILAAKVVLPSDIRRAAARIMSANPLGGICGIT